MSEVKTGNADFEIKLKQKQQLVNTTLKQILTEQSGINNQLRKALEYTLQSPGKRIRSALILWCCELLSGKINPNAKIAAAAIEMVHTYSLVHDDLPAMDNDDLRRGRASCHVNFDEAIAILTGDALLTLAFGILAKKIDEPDTAVKLIAELAEAAGPAGMIAGQMGDLKAQNNSGNKKLLEQIHTNKTAKMFRCAAAMGAICGNAGQEQYRCLCKYGLKIGLGFQIADDILDISASSEQLGKTAGKDAASGKMTYPKVVGLEKSRQLAENLAAEAIAAIESFGEESTILKQLAEVLLQRTR